MLDISRCEGTDSAFVALTMKLDEELGERYGALMDFFGAYNRSSDITTALVARYGGEPVGCGCFKPFSKGTVEIKRMFVRQDMRGKGIAQTILRALEDWARELGNRAVMIETGILQPEAIRLYEAAGYKRTVNYEPYIGVEESVCFRKSLD